MSSVLLILPYFGKWPIWFDAYLLSIKKNPTIHWLIVTDCAIPEVYPANCNFVKMTLLELNLKINATVEANVPLTARKLCDMRPAYGEIFKEYLLDYDFWGFCDADIIWGDIRKFITDDILNQYDIISSRKNTLSGHFSLFRNTTVLNNIYKRIPNYVQLFENEKLMRLDEEGFTEFLKENYNLAKIYWPAILLNQERGRDSWQGYYLDNWLWKEGKVLQLMNNDYVNEVMYLHFISWKRKMKICQVKYDEFCNMFYISYTGIRIDKHNFFLIKINDFKNLFYGFWFRENMKFKMKKYKKRIKRKINKSFK